MQLNLSGLQPSGLTRRARSFLAGHGVKIDVRPVDEVRQWWLEQNVPADVVDRIAGFHQRWGGLLLPPSSEYNGGPKWLEPDLPVFLDGVGWYFEAGEVRWSMNYWFTVGPEGEFGVQSGDRHVPLYGNTEGWVESLALEHHATSFAPQISRITGDDVDDLDLAGYLPVPEVQGRADTWWRGPDSLLSVRTGVAECLDVPAYRKATLYAGLDEWDLRPEEIP